MGPEYIKQPVTGLTDASNVAITGGTISGTTITENFTTSTNPASSVATTTAIVDAYNGVLITTNVNNTQAIANPTAATVKMFTVINNDTSSSNQTIKANSVDFVLTPGEAQTFIWDGSAWGPTDLGITAIPVPVTQGGTGLATLTSNTIYKGNTTNALAASNITDDGTNVSVPDIKLTGNILGTPTYATMGDLIDKTISSGYVSGGAITDDAAGGIAISQVEGYIKITDSATAVTKAFTLAAGGFLSAALTDNSINYVYVDYNSGTPQFAVTTDRTTIKTTTQFPIGRVYKVGTDIEILQSGIQLQNYVRRNHERLVSRGNMERMSGSVISETGTKQVAVTAGVWYVGSNKLSFDAITSAVTNFDHYYYYTGAAWAEAVATGTIDNTNYNNIASGLAELTANRYGVHWVYQCFEGDISVVYGQGDYTLSQAEASMPPASIPDYLAKFGVLIGRIIIKKSASAFTSTASSFTTMFVPESVTTHNNLAGLQGGTTDQYYHLTSAEYTGTGTNEFVRKTSPTLVTPLLGTPTSGDLQNCTAATTTTKGVTVYSGTTKAVAGTDTASAMTPADVAAAQAVLAREPNQGVNMTYAASGSSGITVADNDNIDFGTGNFTLVWKGNIPDWAVETYLFSKYQTSAVRFLFRNEASKKFTLYFADGVGSNVNSITTTSHTVTNNTGAEIALVVTRETALVDGRWSVYINGVLFETVTITARTPVNISNTGTLQILGYVDRRCASTTIHTYTFNRALTAAEVLHNYRSGPKLEWFDPAGVSPASQTALTSGTLVVGKEYTIDTFVAGDDFANVGGTNVSGNTFVATGTAPTTWTNSSSLRRTGITWGIMPEGMQPAPGQCLDFSGNNLHALQPATGSSLTRSKRDFTIKWTNTWAGTHGVQYIGGLNQAILPPNCYIDSIIGVITGGTIEDIIIGDGSDTDRWVTITTGLAAGTVAFTIANAISDGTNYKMTVDPDANFTGSIAWTINGKIL